MSEESKINPKSFFGEEHHGAYDSAAASMPEFGENMQKAAQLTSDLDGAESEFQRLVVLMDFMMSQLKEFYGITETESIIPWEQEELNKKNNEKLPLGLTMTPDGQNIDFGKFAGDKARMVGEMAKDPIFADKLKEKGKEFGFENMTGEKFQEIANQQGDDIQESINQFARGTAAHQRAQVADDINISTKQFQEEANKPKFGLIPEGREKGGPVTSGKPYLVGEKGPEMIIPNSSGQVITNTNLKSLENERNNSMGDEREDLKILANMQQTQMKQFFGITNTVAGLTGGIESGFKVQTQEELNAENNAKLPLGLTMTRDGQNIDLGKFAGDKARMIGEMASDPKFEDALKERGKEFGFSDMTGAQFKEIANKQGDELQREINQYTPGTDAYEMAEISSQFNTGNPFGKKSNFGLISDPEGREKGGSIRSGQPYLVGERGPEMVIPNSAGQVITNTNLKALKHERNISMLNKNTSRRKLVIQPVIRNNNHTVRYRG